MPHILSAFKFLKIVEHILQFYVIRAKQRTKLNCDTFFETRYKQCGSLGGIKKDNGAINIQYQKA